MQHLKLAQPPQAPAAAELQTQVGQGHGGRQAAAGAPGARGRQAHQALIATQHGQQPVLFAQGLAAQHQGFDGLFRHRP